MQCNVGRVTQCEITLQYVQEASKETQTYVWQSNKAHGKVILDTTETSRTHHAKVIALCILLLGRHGVVIVTLLSTVSQQSIRPQGGTSKNKCDKNDRLLFVSLFSFLLGTLGFSLEKKIPSAI